jgi:hypothetical protein
MDSDWMSGVEEEEEEADAQQQRKAFPKVKGAESFSSPYYKNKKPWDV